MSIKESKKRNQLQTNAIVDIQSSMLETSKRMGELSDNVERLTGIMVAIASSMKVDLGDNLDDASDSIKRFVRESDTSTDKKQQENKMVGLLVQNIRKAAVAIAEHAQSIQNTQNQLVQGMSISQAQATAIKDRVKGVVDQLNDEDLFKTKYSTDKVFQELSKVFVSTSTRDQKTLDTITGPMTLASQTLSIDIGKMTTMFSRFYTRYTFSSESMKETLEGILDNSINNNVSQDKLVENMAVLSDTVEFNARERLGSGKALEEYMTQFNRAINVASARYESIGYDTSESVSMLKDIMQGKINTDIVAKLNLAGTSYRDVQKLLEEGTIESVNAAMDAVVTGSGKWAETLHRGGNLGGTAAEEIGMNDDSLIAAANAAYNVSSLSDWLATNNPNNISLEQQANEKFVGIGESIDNTLSNIAADVSTILQEFGPGLSGEDIRSVLTGVLGISAGTNLVKVLTKLTGKTVADSAVSTATGAETTAAAGGAAGISGAVGNAVSNITATATGAMNSIAEFAGSSAGWALGSLAPALPDVIESYKNEFKKENDWKSQSDQQKEIQAYIGQIDSFSAILEGYKSGTGEGVDKALSDFKDSLESDEMIDKWVDKYWKDIGGKVYQASDNDIKDILRAANIDVGQTDWGYTDLANGDYSFNRDLQEVKEALHNLSDEDIEKLKHVKANTGSLGTTYTLEGKYATGLQSVPHDDYLASLHEGERVLTKSEAETLRRIGNLNNLEDLYKEKLSKTQQTDTSSKELVSMMGDLISILLQWRDEESSAMRTNERLTRLSYATQKVSRYEVVN